jgi:nanoRNase/pAp phosphatase (c-di-AMP/oligoRNAs hydrolase)
MADEPVEKPKTKNVEKALNGYQDFHDALSALKEDDKVAVFSHSCPDPDAIGSMMGMKWLLSKRYGLESDLFYDGEVSHPQNGIMVNLLDPSLGRVSEDYVSEKYALRILVDTIPSYAGVGEHTVLFDIVIDHHKDMPAHDFKGLMIHKKVGSCAGIIYDMIKHLCKSEANLWFDDEVDGDVKVATGLIAGVMTDTNFMMADDCTEYERHAFNDLFEYRNSGYLHQIVFFKRRKFWIDKKAAACSSAEIDEEGYAIVGLGLIPTAERDLIADMAEEMVTWATVETAIAFGVIGGDRIEASVRSSNASLSVSNFCKKLGGKYGSGGGKHGKGAYQLPLAGFSIDDDEDEIDAEEAWVAIKKKESKRIQRIIKK